MFLFCFFFFFSSRRRHTRLTCDWSSDVCSSDLEAFAKLPSRFDLPPDHRRLFGRDIAGTGLALDLLREEEVRTMGCLRIVLTGAGSLSALHPAFTERTSSHRFRMREGCC